MNPSPSIRRGKRTIAAAATLGLLCLISLCANFIANDRPLLIKYHEKIYFPIFQNLSSQTFGPQFLPTLTDYQNPEIKAAIRADGWMLFPPIPYGYDTIIRDAPPAPAPPSAQNWLGTDSASRDVLARLIYGMRLSLLFGVLLTGGASVLGIAAGAVQGFYGGLTDLLCQRSIEIWLGLPQLFLIIILAGIFVPGFWGLLIILMAFSWTTLTNRVRAEFLRARNLDYVIVAKTLGLSNWRIMRHHILPNALVSVLTFLPFILAESITLLAGLDYLGFGLPPAAPSLGQLINDAQANPQAPWLGIATFVTISILLLSLVHLGDSFNARSAK